MKLWHLKSNGPGAKSVSDSNPWNFSSQCMNECVIRAESEEAARAIASIHAGGEGSDPWFDPHYTSCSELEVDGVSEFIIDNYEVDHFL